MDHPFFLWLILAFLILLCANAPDTSDITTRIECHQTKDNPSTIQCDVIEAPKDDDWVEMAIIGGTAVR